MKIEQRSTEYRAIIEEALDNWLNQFSGEPQKQLYDAMRYSLMGGGKRLRPIFTLEFCRMCCGDWKPAAPFAAAVPCTVDNACSKCGAYHEWPHRQSW